MQFFIFVSILCLFLENVGAFYMYSNSGDRKCFFKELPQGALLRSTYKVQVHDSTTNRYVPIAASNGRDMTIDIEEVFDDNHRVVHQFSSIQSGEVTFVAVESGEHKICFQPNQSDLGRKKLRIDVEFTTGSVDDIDSKKTTKLKTLHRRVIALIESVREIKYEQEMVRERETLFRDASEKVNFRAIWWILSQIVVLVAICVLQMSYLGKFFVKQKII